MIVGGDVGGTKTLLGVFEPAAPSPSPRRHARICTAEYGSFVEILDEFERAASAPRD